MTVTVPADKPSAGAEPRPFGGKAELVRRVSKSGDSAMVSPWARRAGGEHGVFEQPSAASPVPVVGLGKPPVVRKEQAGRAISAAGF